MSEELERVKALRSHKHKSEKPPQQHTSHTTSDVDSVSSQHQKAKSVLHTKPKLKDSVDSFGGFKKGFLFPSSDSKRQVKGAPVSQKTSSAPTTTKTQTKSDEIPFIKPKDKEKSSLEFPEVQQAMKESFPLLQSQGKRNIMQLATSSI